MIWPRITSLVLRLLELPWKLVYAGYRSQYEIDRNFRFNGTGIQLYGDGRIRLGPKSYIGTNSSIQAAPGRSVSIGQHCRISHNVRIYTSTAMADMDFLEGPERTRVESVDVGDGVWIGANVYIGPGIKIGSNAVVGVNSVVTHDIPAFEIWGGVPARFIRRKAMGGMQ